MTISITGYCRARRVWTQQERDVDGAASEASGRPVAAQLAAGRCRIVAIRLLPDRRAEPLRTRAPSTR